MKKLIILFVSVCCALCAYGQGALKIALYITGDSDFSIKKVFGNKLSDAISQDGTFKAVDYTTNFDAEVKKQQGFNHIVTVEDILALEERSDADYLCIVSMVYMVKDNSIVATVYNSANEELGTVTGGNWDSIAEMDRTARNLSGQITNTALGIPNEQPKKRRGERLRIGGRETAKQETAKQETAQDVAPTTPIDDSLLFNMIYVEGGAFMMGCPEGQKTCGKEEMPTHRVTVSDFYISATEVTYAQWKAVMGSYPVRNFKGEDQLPVAVNWVEIQDFLAKLNARTTGAKYSLPTEAQWEYAARGGESSKGYKYSGSSDVDEVAWYADNSGRKAHVAGGKQANELGLYDMSGNVWEWCRDRYDKYSDTEQTDPVITDSGKDRVLRGGSWDAKREDVQVWRRSSGNPEQRVKSTGFRPSSNIGFRLVRDANK
ncbi:MAG: formylglycine-generating enzyme family protein [Prevotellaceae bacterium]|jgi:formylglycine-generating enzyme required for sulfatase activity|nr:formylglycine-generating enzyme family protein [Prevotellaceae bacterium]